MFGEIQPQVSSLYPVRFEGREAFKKIDKSFLGFTFHLDYFYLPELMSLNNWQGLGFIITSISFSVAS